MEHLDQSLVASTEYVPIEPAFDKSIGFTEAIPLPNARALASAHGSPFCVRTRVCALRREQASRHLREISGTCLDLATFIGEMQRAGGTLKGIAGAD